MSKLEQHIKEKLAERRIQPSKNTWEKVAAGLSAPAQERSRNKFWYYAIAASFIGLLVASVFYTAKTSTVKKAVVVDGNTQESTGPLSQSKTEVPKILENQTVIVKKTDEPLNTVKVTRTKTAPQVEKQKTRLNDGQQENPVALQNLATVEDTVIAQKLDAVVAIVSNLEANNIAVTNAEVDSLLRIAQQQILKEKLLQPNGTVDAMALLTEVEDELDQSFRDQLFDKLKEGFFKVRTAVADRNN